MAARMLVRETAAKLEMSIDDAYTGGLIHDVGKIMLLQSKPEKFSETHRACVSLTIARRTISPCRWKQPARTTFSSDEFARMNPRPTVSPCLSQATSFEKGLRSTPFKSQSN